MATAYSTTAPRLIGAHARTHYEARLLEDARHPIPAAGLALGAEAREASHGGASA
ncbi:MAG: hypothetical protein ACJ8CR_20080 [Roseiflexaceae bacterium]